MPFSTCSRIAFALGNNAERLQNRKKGEQRWFFPLDAAGQSESYCAFFVTPALSGQHLLPVFHLLQVAPASRVWPLSFLQSPIRPMAGSGIFLVLISGSPYHLLLTLTAIITPWETISQINFLYLTIWGRFLFSLLDSHKGKSAQWSEHTQRSRPAGQEPDLLSSLNHSAPWQWQDLSLLVPAHTFHPTRLPCLMSQLGWDIWESTWVGYFLAAWISALKMDISCPGELN